MSRLLLRASLWVSVALFCCMNSMFAFRDAPPTPTAADGCEYRSFWIEPENNFFDSVPRIAERTRNQVVLRANESLDRYQLRRVGNRENVYWRLISAGWTDTSGNLNVTFRLSAELKLAQHVFVVMMDDPVYPY